MVLFNFLWLKNIKMSSGVTWGHSGSTLENNKKCESASILPPPQLQWDRGEPQKAVQQYFIFAISSFEPPLSIKHTCQVIGWTKWVLPVNSRAQVPIFGLLK